MNSGIVLSGHQPDLDFTRFIGDIVHQQILSQAIGLGVENPPSIYACYLGSEVAADGATPLEEEGIYHNALLGTVLHFSQGYL